MGDDVKRNIIMNTNVTPLEVEIVIACYCGGDGGADAARLSYGHDASWHSPAAMNARERLINNDIIHTDCTLTQRGRFWLEHILNTPFPVEHKAFTIPARGETP